MSAAPVVSGAHPGTEQETDKQDPFSLSLSLSPSVSFSLPLPLSLHQCVQKATCLSPRHVPSSQPRGPGCFPGQPHGPRGPSSLPRFPRTLPLVQHEACWGSLLSMPLPLLILLLTLATNFWVSPSSSSLCFAAWKRCFTRGPPLPPPGLRRGGSQGTRAAKWIVAK